MASRVYENLWDRSLLYFAASIVGLIFFQGCVLFVPAVSKMKAKEGESTVATSVYPVSAVRGHPQNAPPKAVRDPLVERLTRALYHREPVKRVHAASSLGMLGGRARSAVPALIEKLADKEKWVRRCAAQALGKIGDKRALRPLEQARGDRDQYVAYSAGKAVIKLRAIN